MVLVVASTIRLGFSVPVLEGIARPLLEERVRTDQLRMLLNWFVESEYRGCTARLAQPAGSPANSDNAVDRHNRAPTTQYYLDEYLSHFARRGPHAFGDTDCQVVFVFVYPVVSGNVPPHFSTLVNGPECESIQITHHYASFVCLGRVGSLRVDWLLGGREWDLIRK